MNHRGPFAPATRLLLGAALAVCLSFASPLVAGDARAQVAAPGSLSDLPDVDQVALTEDTAKNAMYAYRDLRQRYGEELPETNDTEGWVDGMTRYADMQSTIQSYGFDDIGVWHQTLSSFILAHLMGVEGHKAELDKAIAQIEESNQLPDAMKATLIARFARFTPSDENIAVAQRLSANPDIAALIAELRE